MEIVVKGEIITEEKEVSLKRRSISLRVALTFITAAL